LTTETEPDNYIETKKRDRLVIFKIALLLICGFFSFGALILPIVISSDQMPLKPGDVATQDITAPRTITYESEILTRPSKDDARSRVQPVYLPTDPAIARRQIEKLRVALDFITTVRFDSYATLEQKMDDLASISDMQLKPDTMGKILSLSDSRWQILQQ